MLDIKAFRDAMAMLGSAISVVTTQFENKNYGMTVSAVCSVTDTPPTLLVCINKQAWSHNFFIASGNLCVNILSADHKELSGIFSNKSTPMEDRFITHNWSSMCTGSPALDNSLVSFDCKISSVHSVGSHSVLFAEVIGIKMGQQSNGLIYFNRKCHDIPIII